MARGMRTFRGAPAGVELADGHVAVAVPGRAPVEAALPAGAVTGGEVRDPAAVAAVLRELLPGARRTARVALVTPRLVARVLELPAAVGDDALADAVRFQARDVLPGDLDACHVAHLPLTGGDGTRRVLVTAVERVVTDALARALDAAGLRRASIHAGPVAAAALADPAACELLLCVDDLTTVVVAEAGRCAFFRTVPVATQADLVAEASASLDYYLRLPGAHEVARVRLLGGDADPALAERLRAETALEVVAGAPVRGALAGALLRQPALELTTVADARRRAAGPARPSLVPIVACGAVVAAAGGGGMLWAGHRVSQREDLLAARTAQVTALQADATALAPARAVATQRAQTEAAIRDVLGARFDWSRALGALAAATPRGSRASAVRGTVDTTVQVASGGGTPRATLRAARPNPALEIAGCSPTNAAAARYVRRLGAMAGVTSVALGQTTTGVAAAGCAGVAFDAVAFFERFSTPAAGSVETVPAAPAPATGKGTP